MERINISPSLQLFDLRDEKIDLSTIKNRRFMYHSSGLLLLGAEDMVRTTRGILKSHAEEYGEVSERFSTNLPPYDTFVRGWIGVGKNYPHGIIHFAPHVVASCTGYFNTAFDFVEAAMKNGFTSRSILRGFCDPWEQSISNLLGERNEPIMTENPEKRIYRKKHFYKVTWSRSKKLLSESRGLKDVEHDFCIVGYRQPSLEEAEKFIGNIMYDRLFDQVIRVQEISKEEALEDFRMDNWKNQKVFGADDIPNRKTSLADQISSAAVRAKETNSSRECPVKKSEVER